MGNRRECEPIHAAYIATSQDSACVAEQWKGQDLGFGTDFISKARAKASIKREIFLEYLGTMFLLNLIEMRGSKLEEDNIWEIEWIQQLSQTKCFDVQMMLRHEIEE
jgi:hypothetical protein